MENWITRRAMKGDSVVGGGGGGCLMPEGCMNQKQTDIGKGRREESLNK